MDSPKDNNNNEYIDLAERLKEESDNPDQGDLS